MWRIGRGDMDAGAWVAVGAAVLGLVGAIIGLAFKAGQKQSEAEDTRHELERLAERVDGVEAAALARIEDLERGVAAMREFYLRRAALRAHRRGLIDDDSFPK